MVFWDKYKVLITFVITSVIFIFFIINCEDKSTVVIKETVDYKIIVDSLKKANIKESKPVYIDTGSTKYIEGKKIVKWRDSIIYLDRPSNTTITANSFNTELTFNKAKANLNIVSTGEVLDVTGTIEYPEKTITREITKTIAKSGAFLYLESDFGKSPERFELGVDVQIKNKLLLGTSIDYNTITNSVNANFKIGVSIWQK